MAAVANGAPSSPTNGDPSISWPLNRPSSQSPWSPRVEHELRAREAPAIASAAARSTFAPARSTAPCDPDLLPQQRKSLSSISLQAFGLGAGFTLGVLISVALALDLVGGGVGARHWWRVPCFLSILATFHFLEFWTTAHFNTPRADASSFLLFNNGAEYFIAQNAAFMETCIMTWWRSHAREDGGGSVMLYVPFRTRQTVAAGFALVMLGQVVRSTAMAHLGTNFHHIVQVRRSEGHELITSGIYAVLRHPSYFGFFWWAVGTQLVLGNLVCLVLYIGVLWRFFGHRIKSKSRIMDISYRSIKRLS